MRNTFLSKFKIACLAFTGLSLLSTNTSFAADEEVVAAKPTRTILRAPHQDATARSLLEATSGTTRIYDEFLYDGIVTDAYGPRSAMLTLAPGHRHLPNAKGDYRFDVDTKSFVDVGTFAVAQRTFDMVGNAMKRLYDVNSSNPSISTAITQWTYQTYKYPDGRTYLFDGPITVYPDSADSDNNAYYSRVGKGRVVKFGKLKRGATVVGHTNKSSDIIAHELGHAILDVVRGDLWYSTGAEALGLHEAFGDIMAWFYTTLDTKACEDIMVMSKGNIMDPAVSALPSVGEEFGERIFGDKNGLRNMSLTTKLSAVLHHGPHTVSKVFSSAFYAYQARFVESVYDDGAAKYRQNPGLILHEVSRRTLPLFLQGVILAKGTNPTFGDIMKNYHDIATVWKPGDDALSSTFNHAEAIKDVAEEREIFWDHRRAGIKSATVGPVTASKPAAKRICGTSCGHDHA